MKRNYTKKPKTRKPLTIDKVKLINDFCDARRDLSEMDKATLTAAWTGGVRLMLRIGEITTENLRFVVGDKFAGSKAEDSPTYIFIIFKIGVR